MFLINAFIHKFDIRVVEIYLYTWYNIGNKKNIFLPLTNLLLCISNTYIFPQTKQIAHVCRLHAKHSDYVQTDWLSQIISNKPLFIYHGRNFHFIINMLLCHRYLEEKNMYYMCFYHIRPGIRFMVACGRHLPSFLQRFEYRVAVFLFALTHTRLSFTGSNIKTTWKRGGDSKAIHERHITYLLFTV